MKVSVFENDKSTAKDEIILGIITVLILIAGIVLVVVRPTFGLPDSVLSISFGVIMILLAVMFIPCLIYRLFTNDKHVANK